MIGLRGRPYTSIALEGQESMAAGKLNLSSLAIETMPLIMPTSLSTSVKAPAWQRHALHGLL